VLGGPRRAQAGREAAGTGEPIPRINLVLLSHAHQCPPRRPRPRGPRAPPRRIRPPR
jgi:hypothetical protein